LIPFSGSRHTQRTAISLAAGATMFWWEVLAPGRLAAGERFGFERLRVESSVRVAGRLAFKEDFLLRPAERSLNSTARMGEYSHMASFYAFQEGRTAAEWRRLEDQLNRTVCGGLWGASTLASNGVIVRGLNTTEREFPVAVVKYWNVARRFLTGQDAAPPRKVY
jgi:urease accessory protein